MELSEPITEAEAMQIYYHLPCQYESVIVSNGDTLLVEVNAASYIWLHNEDTSFYYGCSSDECQKYFLMQGGNVERDLDVHSDD